MISAETYVKVLLKRRNMTQTDLLNKMKKLQLAKDETLVLQKLNNAINIRMGFTWARRIELALDLPQYSLVRMVGNPTEAQWEMIRGIGNDELDKGNSNKIHTKSK